MMSIGRCAMLSVAAARGLFGIKLALPDSNNCRLGDNGCK